MEVMTVAEYSTHRGQSVQYIYKTIRDGFLPDGVISKKISGKSVLLYVDKQWIRKNPVIKKENSLK